MAEKNPFIETPSLDFKAAGELSAAEAEKQIKQLRDAINHHDRLYYNEANPVISDSAYDRLFKRLQELEKEFPEYDSENSPTKRVGAAPRSELTTVEHVVPMLSLSSTLAEDEIRDFDRFIEDNLGHHDFSYCAELKFDGLSVELVYENGEFARAATRGDGSSGEEITANIRTIPGLPLRLTGDDIPGQLALRGEVYIPLDGFQQMNQRRVERGEEPFANPRNAAAGSIRQLDSSITASRPLDIFVYDIMHAPDLPIDTQQQIYELFPQWGLPLCETKCFSDDIEEIIDFRNRMAENRENLNFEIDGIVIKINEFEYRNQLGERQNNPRWAIAYKFPPRREATTVEKISVQVGRTGKLTPVALLKPVEVGGVTIARAALHNLDFIREKDIREGDRVRIERAGDVIPYVAERIEESEGKRSEPFKMPEKCPACNSDVIVEGAFHRCSGEFKCPAQLQGHLEHFVSRAAMDIKGLGEKELRKLREKNLVDDIAALYELSEDELLDAGLFKNDVYMKIKQEAPRPETALIIYAADIKGVGPNTAIELSEKIETHEQLEEYRRSLDSPEEKARLKEYMKNPERAAAEVGKAVHNLLRELEESKDVNLDRFIYALGIRNVGRHTAGLLARRFGTLEKLIQAGEQKLMEIKEVGPEVARCVLEFFSKKENRRVIERLLENGVNPRPVKTETEGPLEGLKLVFTGSLENYTRSEIKEKVASAGGRAVSSVSSNTDYVVAGKNPGNNKITAAEKNNVPIISEQEFQDLLNK